MNVPIERRANLSYEQFAREYLWPNKPVIVTDAMRNWKALERWTPDFFKHEFGDMKFALAEGKAGYKENAGGVEYTMAQFINRVLASSDENPAPYFRNRILYELFPSLKD